MMQEETSIEGDALKPEPSVPHPITRPHLDAKEEITGENQELIRDIKEGEQTVRKIAEKEKELEQLLDEEEASKRPFAEVVEVAQEFYAKLKKDAEHSLKAKTAHSGLLKRQKYRLVNDFSYQDVVLTGDERRDVSEWEVEREEEAREKQKAATQMHAPLSWFLKSQPQPIEEPRYRGSRPRYSHYGINFHKENESAVVDMFEMDLPSIHEGDFKIRCEEEKVDEIEFDVESSPILGIKTWFPKWAATADTDDFPRAILFRNLSGNSAGDPFVILCFAGGNTKKYPADPTEFKQLLKVVLSWTPDTLGENNES